MTISGEDVYVERLILRSSFKIQIILSCDSLFYRFRVFKSGFRFLDFGFWIPCFKFKDTVTFVASIILSFLILFLLFLYFYDVNFLFHYFYDVNLLLLFLPRKYESVHRRRTGIYLPKEAA